MSLYSRLIDGDKILNPPQQVTLVNLLPFQVLAVLMTSEYGSTKVQPLVSLGPYESKTINYPGTALGVQLTCVKGTNPTDIPLTMPLQFGNSAKYFFGGYSWNSFDADVNGYNLYADMPGIKIHNHFPFGAELSYKDLSFSVGPNSWRDLKGGSSGIVYFDNQGNGIDVGDTFEVKIKDGGVLKKIGEFKIPNRYVRNVHIGVTAAS